MTDSNDQVDNDIIEANDPTVIAKAADFNAGVHTVKFSGGTATDGGKHVTPGSSSCVSAAMLSTLQRKRRVPCYGKLHDNGNKDENMSDMNKNPLVEGALEDSEGMMSSNVDVDEPRNESSSSSSTLLRVDMEDPDSYLSQQEEEEELSMVHDATQPLNDQQGAENDLDKFEKMESNAEISDSDILSAVDTLFAEADIHTFTVKDIVSSIQDLFQTKLKKDKRKLIKDRLVQLVNQMQEEKERERRNKGKEEDNHSGSEEEGEEDHNSHDDHYEQEDGDDDDYSEFGDTSAKQARSKKRISTKKRSSAKTVQPKKETTTRVDSTPVRSSRPKRTPAKKRIPSHVKIHHESLRKRQLAEAKVLSEEMQEKVHQKISEQDRKRAEEIAKKFQTDSEELRRKREEERKKLIVSLEEKRMKLLSYDVEKDEDSDNHNNMVQENENHDKNSDDEEMDIDEETESDSDEDELEILDMEPNAIDPSPPAAVKDLDASRTADKGLSSQAPISSTRRLSPTSVAALSPSSTKPKEGTKERTMPKQQKVCHDPRKILRKSLKKKQFERGNMWLARELGYDKVEDHIRECKLVEQKKLLQILALEKQRRSMATLNNGDHSTAVATKELDEIPLERTRVKLDEESEPEEEEDEEMAMAAQELERSKNEETHYDDDDNHDNDDESLIHDKTQDSQDCTHDVDQGVVTSDPLCNSHDANNFQNKSIVASELNEKCPSDANEAVNIESNLDSKSPVIYKSERNDTVRKGDSNYDHTSEAGEKNVNAAENAIEPKNKIRNSLWKEMLKREAEMVKKMKKRRGDLVEVEAEEEEEEEAVAGLEDFGFTVNTKKSPDDDDENENIDADEEDFENIVDDLSDNEGDEEAGEAARKAMALKEDKLRHKEIMRRIRDGYDGRRGGIAGGLGNTRGNLAFEELVAADNKETAIKLGLANDDELDSEAEETQEKAGADEIDDENALLVKSLMDRHLNRTNIPAEEFSESEDDDDDSQNKDDVQSEDDEADAEQQLLAKRFARRARMNRLIEMYGGDEEFSQGRLLDQNEEMRKELKSIRSVPIGARRQTSFASSAASGGDSSSQLGDTFNTSIGSKLGSSEHSLLSSSSLSFALSKSRHSFKRKSSFLEFSRQNTKRKSFRPAGVSLGHVVFACDNQPSSLSKSSSSLPSKKIPVPTFKDAKSTTVGKSRSSLWSRVASNGFKSQKL